MLAIFLFFYFLLHLEGEERVCVCVGDGGERGRGTTAICQASSIHRDGIFFTCCHLRNHNMKKYVLRVLLE